MTRKLPPHWPKALPALVIVATVGLIVLVSAGCGPTEAEKARAALSQDLLQKIADPDLPWTITQQERVTGAGRVERRPHLSLGKLHIDLGTGWVYLDPHGDPKLIYKEMVYQGQAAAIRTAALERYYQLYGQQIEQHCLDALEQRLLELKVERSRGAKP